MFLFYSCLFDTWKSSRRLYDVIHGRGALFVVSRSDRRLCVPMRNHLP